MIVFLNFAPLSFGGGAERWMVSVAEDLSKKEKVRIISVAPSIGNLYARLVLRRQFDARVSVTDSKYDHQSITWESLLPFSNSWKKIRKSFLAARLIYSRLEINELLLLLYFCGPAIMKKTVIGLHSPFFYVHSPLTVFERLHNWVYHSAFIRTLLSRAQKIHVLNPSQKEILEHEYGLKNVYLIPNFIENEGSTITSTPKGTLRICFTGELSHRKGADILLEVIKHSPKTFTFEIAGDGYMRAEFTKLVSPNVTYHGYVDQTKISTILEECDVLLLPSRAESFSLASLDALSRGLTVVCSPDISPNMLEKYLVISRTGTDREYVSLLKKINTQKASGALQKRRQMTAKEVREMFSKPKILHRLQKELFS